MMPLSNHSPLRTPLIALLLTACITGVCALLFSSLDGSAWQGLKMSDTGMYAEYCEQNHLERFTRQWMNAWSNVVYLFFGLWLLLLAWKDAGAEGHNSRQRFPALTAWTGLVLAGLSAASFFFHASLTRPAQYADMQGVYSLSLALVGGGLYRLFLMHGMKEGRNARLIFMMVIIALSIVFWLLRTQLRGLVALPILAGLGVVLTFYLFAFGQRRFSALRVFSFLASLGLASACQFMDWGHIACHSESPFQLHALWHFFTAWSAFLSVQILRNELPHSE